MKKIGQGWQYNVYDAGTRVEKHPTTPWQVRWKILRSDPQLAFRPGAWTRKVARVISERDEAVATLRRYHLPDWMMANLRIDGERVLQDKVIPLGELLTDDHAGRLWIDRYIDFMRACWQHGFAETSYNFTVNHGVDTQGRVVVLDFGEVSFAPLFIRREIEVQLWARGWSCNHDLPPGLRPYFLEAMDTRVTPAIFDQLWTPAEPARTAHPTPTQAPDRTPAHAPTRQPAPTIASRQPIRPDRLPDETA